MISDTRYHAACNEVAAFNLNEHMAEFSRWQKMAGTAEELSSLEYVERCTKSYGYRTKLIFHDAYISLPIRARVAVGSRDFEAITHSFSPSTGEEGIEAELIQLTAADRATAVGKIAILDGIATPAACASAFAKGAIGIIFVSPDDHRHEMCISPVWGNPTLMELGDMPSGPVVTVNRATGADLNAAALAGKKAILWAEVDTGWRKTPILVADMDGPALSDDAPFVLFSGHHDTWYYGVMDNGGANATMLEAARVLAGHQDVWKRSLRICFWSGHSQGRYSSSAWYADNHWFELFERCLVHVNVDSTGGRGNTIVSDAPCSAELYEVAQRAVYDNSGQTLIDRRLSRSGDQSFWGIGVPGMFMSLSEQDATKVDDIASGLFGGGKRKGAGLGWWWHTPQDTLENIDSEILVRDTRIYVQGLLSLLAEPVFPLDYRRHMNALKGELRQLDRTIAARIDLKEIWDLVQGLDARLDALHERIAQARSQDDIDVCNRTLQGLSRLLVPLDYTNGDPYGHDLAIPQSAWPSLDPLRRLAEAPPGSDLEKFRGVEARRAANRIVGTLREAASCIDTISFEGL